MRLTLRRAQEPFRFFARFSLAAATGVRAADLRELLEGIRTVPDSSIYAHTFRFIQEHQFLAHEPANDFAPWISSALQDEEAAERLLAVDPVRCRSIRAIRTELINAIEDYLRRNPLGRRAPAGAEFHFLQSVRYSLPTAIEAWTLDQFGDAVRRISGSSLYLHVFEARLRPPFGANDFSIWLERELGEEELASEIARVDPYSLSNESIRASIIAMIDKRLEALFRG